MQCRRFILAAALLVLLARPASAAVSLDLGMASPYLSLRQITPGGETDLILQSYGLSLHGVFLGEKTGFQVEVEYAEATNDSGGRGTAVTHEQLTIKYPRRQEKGDEGNSYYYWLLSCRQDETTDALANNLTLQTALIGLEIYNTVDGNGTFAIGAGVGWRELATASDRARGYAASVWIEFTVEFGGNFLIRFNTATTWAQPESLTGRVMERDTWTSIGAGLKF